MLSVLKRGEINLFGQLGPLSARIPEEYSKILDEILTGQKN